MRHRYLRLALLARWRPPANRHAILIGLRGGMIDGHKQNRERREIPERRTVCAVPELRATTTLRRKTTDAALQGAICTPATECSLACMLPVRID